MIVYRHRRLDTYEVFYVGIGKHERRAYQKYKRSKYWKNIVNKHGYIVEIIATPNTWGEACELEVLLISEYGRLDLGTGNLVNMTAGGDGSVNLAQEVRDILRKKQMGRKVSEETKEKLSLLMKGNTYSKGNKLSKETRHKMSVNNKGEGNPMYGKKHSQESIKRRSLKRSIAVIRYSLEGEFEKEYISATEAMMDGYTKTHISACCKGKCKKHKGKIWKYKHDVMGN